jgi:hypothetical protein
MRRRRAFIRDFRRPCGRGDRRFGRSRSGTGKVFGGSRLDETFIDQLGEAGTGQADARHLLKQVL